jgi:hypothetical protein
VAPILSHHKEDVSLILIPCSLRRVSTNFTLVAVLAKDLYSASMLDLDTVSCFRALHDIRLGPKNMKNPPVELLSHIHDA